MDMQPKVATLSIGIIISIESMATSGCMFC